MADFGRPQLAGPGQLTRGRSPKAERLQYRQCGSLVCDDIRMSALVAEPDGQMI